jgi:hypothetical protein
MHDDPRGVAHTDREMIRNESPIGAIGLYHPPAERIFRRATSEWSQYLARGTTGSQILFCDGESGNGGYWQPEARGAMSVATI